MASSRNWLGFEWRAPADMRAEGFSWGRAHPKQGDTFKTEPQNFLLAGGIRWRYYKPFEEQPTLFRTFADTDPTEEAVAKFANQHGSLGAREWVKAVSAASAPEWGERLSTWEAEIVGMHHAVRVADALRAKAHADLQEWFRLKGHPGEQQTLEYTPWPQHVPKVAVQYPGRDTRRLRFNVNLGVAGDPTDDGAQVPDNADLWALAFIRALANKRLQEHTTALVLYGAENRTGLPFTMRVVPRNLLGALWLQFGLGLEGDKGYQRCEYCGAWFEISTEPHGMRRGSRYCRTKCRVRAFRARGSEPQAKAPKGRKRRQRKQAAQPGAKSKASLSGRQERS